MKSNTVVIFTLIAVSAAAFAEVQTKTARIGMTTVR